MMLISNELFLDNCRVNGPVEEADIRAHTTKSGTTTLANTPILDTRRHPDGSEQFPKNLQQCHRPVS